MARNKRQIDESQVEELDEDSVSNNVDTSPVEGMSKTNAMSIMMKGVADSDNWEEIYAAVMAQVGQHSKAIPDGTAQKNAASTAMKGAIKEDLAAIFGDSKELSEDFKEKATTLFESAVGARVAFIEAELQEQYAQALDEELEDIHESIIDKVDEYLSYVADNWLEENQIAIEKSVTTELAESFMVGLGELFASHNFNVPEEKVEVVDMLADKVEALEEQNNQIMLENIELTNTLEAFAKDRIVADLSESLTATEAEKFKLLVEDFDLNDVDEYTTKLETVLEHHFGKKSTPKTQLINEEITYTEEEASKELSGTKEVSPRMKAYVEALKGTRNG